MDNEINPNKQTLLFVDDEVQSLKYFTRIFKNAYNIFTAETVDDGLEIVNSNHLIISVVITDQRMPEKFGVELLKQIKEKYPKIVRILTTAFTEIDYAIDAVNLGHIYQYVEKPWDLRVLENVIKQAVDYYQLNQDRDRLLREKLSVLQRLIITDRIQSLSVMSTALRPKINNSSSALLNFLDYLPKKFHKDQIDKFVSKSSFLFLDLGNIARDESKFFIDVTNKIVDLIDNASDGQKQILLFKDFLGNNFNDDNILIDHALDAIEINVHEKMLFQTIVLIQNILKKLIDDEITINIECSVNDVSTKNVSIKLYIDDYDDNYYDKMYSILMENKEVEISINLLTALFMTHHHFGEINIVSDNEQIFGLEILLPTSTGSHTTTFDINESWDKLQNRFAAWDVALL